MNDEKRNLVIVAIVAFFIGWFICGLCNHRQATSNFGIDTAAAERTTERLERTSEELQAGNRDFEAILKDIREANTNQE